MKVKLLAAVIFAAAPLGAVQAMTLEAFLKKADVLEKKGVIALLSSDYKALKGEVQSASTRLKAEREAARKSGRRGPYCPPSKASLTSKEVLAYFRTVPPAQRPRLSVTDALRGLLARKYPCR